MALSKYTYISQQILHIVHSNKVYISCLLFAQSNPTGEVQFKISQKDLQQLLALNRLTEQ